MRPADGDDRAELFVRHDGRVEDRLDRVAGDDAQEAIAVDLVFEFPEEAVERPDETVGSIRADASEVEHGAGGFDRRVHDGGGQLVLAQQAVERRMPRDARLDGFGFGAQRDVGAARGRRCRCRRAAGGQRRDREGQNDLPPHVGGSVAGGTVTMKQKQSLIPNRLNP